MNKHFICATHEISSFERHVPAPCFRRAFVMEAKPDGASLSICGLGFYLLYVNGRDITKGLLAPYVSDPDHYCYYDTYDLTPYLQQGENVIGVVLGNGYMNPFGGEVWDLHRVPWRGAPRLALKFCAQVGEETVSFVADEQFKTHPSPITFDEMRMGEHYDANLEITGWSLPDFDDSTWTPALVAEAPRGEMRHCDVEPIRVEKERKPVRITAQDGGYLYDFGVNTAGLCRLNVRARRGQVIEMRYGELLTNGHFSQNNLCFSLEKYPFYPDYIQKTRYTARGEGVESWTPVFTYFGFRYVLVKGITPEQATEELLTMLICHSDLETVGDFSCSDATVNQLFEMARNSDLSNFYYIPTDCPHREKLGWTGDASLSADHILLRYRADKSYRAWLANIRKAQNEAGALPGIVPTGGWGFHWGNGPVFDSVLFHLPYKLYRFRGDTEVIRENAHAMVRYLEYIMTQRSENGTVEIGLGDWVPVGKARGSYYTVPVGICNSIMVMDMAGKARKMLEAIGYTHQAAFAKGIYEDMRATVRRVYLSADGSTLGEGYQSGQAIGLYFGVFEEHERQAAFDRLLLLLHTSNDAFDCGFVGMHSLFHVLAEFGEAELAYRMITRREFPSYGYFIEQGETSIPEKFFPDGERWEKYSHNHHFQCDFTRWFMFWVAGLQVVDHKTVRITPNFIGGMDHAEAYHILPQGRVDVRWERREDKVFVCVTLPRGVQYESRLPEGADLEVSYTNEN